MNTYLIFNEVVTETGAWSSSAAWEAFAAAKIRQVGFSLQAPGSARYVIEITLQRARRLLFPDHNCDIPDETYQSEDLQHYLYSQQEPDSPAVLDLIRRYVRGFYEYCWLARVKQDPELASRMSVHGRLDCVFSARLKYAHLGSQPLTEQHLDTSTLLVLNRPYGWNVDMWVRKGAILLPDQLREEDGVEYTPPVVQKCDTPGTVKLRVGLDIAHKYAPHSPTTPLKRMRDYDAVLGCFVYPCLLSHYEKHRGMIAFLHGVHPENLLSDQHGCCHLINTGARVTRVSKNGGSLQLQAVPMELGHYVLTEGEGQHGR